MFLTITGSGTSHGVPVIGCSCAVCTSKNPKDTRLRCSAIIETKDGTTVVIDPGPEFRIQALNYGLKKLDAVLVTHSHADHIHGLDDVRIFSVSRNLPVYANAYTLADMRNRFDYIFKATQEGGGKPHLTLIDCAEFGVHNPLVIGSMRVIPIPLVHGDIAATGWRMGTAAYITDLSSLPESSYKLLTGLDNLIIDALRKRPHQTHLHFAQAFAITQRINAKNTWFTHLCHDVSHQNLTTMLQKMAKENNFSGTILPAYDGLRLTFLPTNEHHFN